MNIQQKVIGLFLLLIGGNGEICSGLDADVGGQFSGWGVVSRAEHEWLGAMGERYLPELTVKQPFSAEKFSDLDISCNMFLRYQSDTPALSAEAELYRLKFRVATPQTETRLGLQKINFGPAQLLRSLRWFDQLDPRDPQQLTDGVAALLFRYTALNNANLWLWGLHGNDELRGNDLLPSTDNQPEFGGRAQFPAFQGELAVTAHTRRVNAESLNIPDFEEQRVALDGRWEQGIGMWFETMLQHQDAAQLPYQWTNMTTLGGDYTFGVGNGLAFTLEHLILSLAETPFGLSDNRHATAYLLSYPLGLFDSVQAIGSYDWENEQFSQYVGWQRTYDNLTLNASLFRYPEREDGVNRVGYEGWGGQVMVVFYH